MKFLESQEPTKRRKPVMKIKKLFTLALTAALTISLAACSGGASATKMTMGTGGSAGTYYGYGGAFSLAPTLQSWGT